MQKLPIDDLFPQFLAALRDAPCVVLTAPPGSGKTTRIPLALLSAPFLDNKRIVMLEPRRLAAVNASRWMAASLGEEAGGTVGYTIRFERRVSSSTRLEVVTEGILSRRLQNDPLLSDVGVVIFDEFHERSLASDLALALCRDVQQGVRPDLKIVVMSATLECGPISALLGHAPIIAAKGKSFPVEIRYLSREPGADIAAATCRAVMGAVREMEGDILVFLPGAGEIRRCQRLLEGEEASPSLLIRPLYGDLPFAAQEEAIMPTDRRRIVLATNIAETSLTIEGVRVVIDSGFSRQLRFDPAAGLNRLVTARISAASAAQRAGRAGRLGPGICLRLWTEHTQATLLPYTPPEIRNADLAPLALELAGWGVRDAGALAWLDPPPSGALGEGRSLLQSLGALDTLGLITPHGRALTALPVHPRLAHMLLIARGSGKGAAASDLAALLAERDIYRGANGGARNQASPSDLLDRLELLAEWRKKGRGKGMSSEVDPYLCRAVDRASQELQRLLGVKGREGALSAEEVGALLANAFPERVARQREPGSDRYQLANGRGGRLSERSAVRNSPFIVAVVMEGGERGDGVVHQASSITQETLRSQFVGNIERRRVVEWDSREGRVIAREEERLGELVLATRQVVPGGDEVRNALVAGLRSSRGLAALGWTANSVQFRARVEFLRQLLPDEGWPDFSENALLAALPDWLGPFLGSARSLTDLGAIDPLHPLKTMLTREQGRRLDEGAPTHLTVPSGSRIAIQYVADGPPVLAVKLQELFGLAETPTVAWGRVSLLLHLLSPAGRPIQVTSDLRNFWNAVYPEVKKELKGRYPKHPWPDDPWGAEPTRKTKKSVSGDARKR